MGTRTFTVQDLPVEERPRERLQALGGQALSAQELLALVLSRGVGGESVMVLTQRLLTEFGSLEGVINASLDQLQTVKGLGLAKAAQLVACLEIARRVVRHEEAHEANQQQHKQITSAPEVYRILKSKIRHYAREHFVVMALDGRDRLLGIDTVAVGTVTTSVVHPRETFEAAIRRHAVTIVIAHNHPSGDLQPSQADLVVTRRLIEAGKLMGIEVRDHIIISKAGYFSFREAELL